MIRRVYINDATPTGDRDNSTPLDLISTMMYAYNLPFQATAGLRSDPDESLSLAGSKSSSAVCVGKPQGLGSGGPTLLLSHLLRIITLSCQF